MFLPRCIKLSLGSPAVMALPPGFLLQSSSSLALSFGSGLLLRRRTEELGSASGSAFAPYSSTAAPLLPFGGEPRAAASSFVSPAYDPSSGVSGSLDYHPFGPLGPYPFGDPSYRKNATRDATATLKAWLSEHRKNPYPTKGEKIMLAIITKMTLTQVSTWFANARRRLKKENKMTWTPRNRSEDEEEEDAIDLERCEDDEESVKLHDEELEPRSERDSCGLTFRDDTSTNRGFTDLDSEDRSHILGFISVSGPPAQNRPLEALRVSGSEHTSPSEEQVDSCCAALGPNPKPKLWSLAEIAMSADKQSSDSSQSRGRSSLSNCPTLPRPLCYTSPFMAGYSSFGPLGSLHGGSHLKGLQQKVLQRSEVATRDCCLPSYNHIELHRLKTGMTNV